MARDLIAAIREKQSAIAKLQAELDEAKALLLGRDRAHPTKHTPRRTKSNVALPYKKNSSVGKAVKILKKAGQPMHIDELAAKIGRTAKKTTLVGNLSRYVKAGRVFYRSAPGEFALLEWTMPETNQPKRSPVKAIASSSGTAHPD